MLKLRAALIALGLAATAAGAQQPSIKDRIAEYTAVKLTADLSKLAPWEQRMLPLLIEAARAMDDGFWMQTYGNRDSLLASLRDPLLRRDVEINYGPWDRLHEDTPFVPGVGAKPLGAAFYPRDLTKAEFERDVANGGAHADSLKGLYTVVRRGPNGSL